MIQLLRDRKFVCGTALAGGILGLGVGPGRVAEAR